jgi:membrane fusion protein (multidrug efflux system)
MMKKRMIIMLIIIGVIFGGIFGYKEFQSYMMKKFMAAGGASEVTVSATKAVMEKWQPEISAVGSLRAVRGVDISSEVTGMVQTVNIKSGDNVRTGQTILQLNADSDVAKLQTLLAARDLAQSVYERNKKQFAAQAVSKASLEADVSDLKSKQAEVAEQEALIRKKTISAPFAGKSGICSVNPGQYLNPGDKIVTLQAIDSIYIDFNLPQQELSRVARNQTVVAATDTYPDKKFKGRISAINSKVDSQTRNVQIEAVVGNPGHKLLPGMYATVKIEAGKRNRYLTIPRTAVTFNTYGEAVYVVENVKDDKGKARKGVKQVFVTVGASRGDQVAIIKGIKDGDIVVTSGQLKLKNGSYVTVNNEFQPLNDPSPVPAEN